MTDDNRLTQLSTVGEVLAQARQTAGITAITGQAILAYIMKRDRAWLLAHTEVLLTTEQATRFTVLLERAAQGEPLAYLTGEREFYGLAFTVTPDVLIPRPETEGLVDAALHWSEQHRQPAPRLVDVGTGSGAIAVTLAVRLPQAGITAVDVSPAALDVARRNASWHGVGERIELVQGSLLADITGPFDIILANLPYIPTDTLPTLDVIRWEPAPALDGGPDGLALIRLLIRQAATRLLPGGLLALEIQYDQGPVVAALCRDIFPTAAVTIAHDLAGLDRIVSVELP
ncbi:MAG: peptide chain release factor N(5)-glutamine methyltransferase [Anaerolineae bacterium]|nr:peptide chain release factor N(5)-glutamine methyltransferase [Anaerolineae bacterium]